MFNLLPEEIKYKIKLNYKLRRLVLITLIIIFIEISLLIFILPTWVISYSRENEALNQTEELNHSPLNSNLGSTTAIIKATNTKLIVINTTLEYPRVVTILDAILKQRNSTIYIDQFLYTSNSDTKATITIGGISSTRESLVSFVNKLKSSGVFKSVDLPISNLAKDNNIDFSINLIVSS